MKVATTLGSAFMLTSLMAQQKPNIIYILADDAGIGDFGCYGQKKIKTPNVDKLCAEGMKFTQHYSGSTVCGPSRSCLMTGQHVGNTRVRGNGGFSLHDEDITVAEVLKDAGYTTGTIGKWGLGEVKAYGGKKGTEDKAPGAPWKQGFDFFYGYLNHSNAHRYYPNYIWRNDKKVLFPDNAKKRTDYIHDHFTKEAVGFIEDNKDKPFFLYLAYTTPHVDLDVPEDSMEPYYDMFKPEKPRGGGGYRKHKTPHSCFAGMISRMDRDVGSIIDTLKKLKIDKNTLVIFTSDNGATNAGGADPNFFDSNSIYRGVKRDLYEGGVRAPHIAWWPGKIKAGTVTDHISTQWDFMATAAELVGVKCPKQSDGISFLPTLLQKGKQGKHAHLYWEFYEQGGKQAVRKGNWKAVRLNVLKNPKAKIQLFNLSKDVEEKSNVASKYPEVAAKMTQLMDSTRSESDYFSFEKGGEMKTKKGKKSKKGKKK